MRPRESQGGAAHNPAWPDEKLTRDALRGGMLAEGRWRSHRIEVDAGDGETFQDGGAGEEWDGRIWRRSEVEQDLRRPMIKAAGGRGGASTSSFWLPP